MGELLQNTKQMLDEALDWVECKSYYYAVHQCPSQGEEMNIRMDLVLHIETDTQIVKFGLCPHCKTLYYRKDHDSRSF